MTASCRAGALTDAARGPHAAAVEDITPHRPASGHPDTTTDTEEVPA
jgi:hypothetical protein